MTSLRAEGLVKRYTTPAETVTAVDDVHLTLAAGEFVCLHGASGSGKSTLLHLLAGLSAADAGSLMLGDVDLFRADDRQRAEVRRSHVGVVFQDHNLLQEFSAWENVALPLEAGGMAAAQARDEATLALELVDIGHLAERRPYELSGGQRQRVGIARALVGGREIVLADEPTGSLDSATSVAIFELFAKLAATGTAILVVSHDPACRPRATRSLEMRDGRIIGSSSL